MHKPDQEPTEAPDAASEHAMKRNFETALSEAAAHKEVPFPAEEYEKRLARIRAAMADAEIDLLFLTAPESLYYVSGFQCEWYQAQSGRAFPPTSGIAVHQERERFIHFETPSEAILTAIGTISEDVRIFPLEHRRDGLPFILQELRAEGWLDGTVGLELHNYRPNPVIARRYQEGFEEAGMRAFDGTDVVRDVRHVKSPLEMEAMTEAARLADIGMAAARGAIRPGATELEVFGEMITAMTREGGEFPGILPPVASGFRTNCLHPLASRKRIEKGERVLVDVCGVYKRYHVNLARTFWVGEPPLDAAGLHDTSVRAFGIIEEMLRPDLPVLELLNAVREHYAAHDLLDDLYWSGGYELGIAFPPDWVGPFVYDLSHVKEDDRFRPMSAVNHECNFFGPRSTGLSATIDTILFHEDRAELASRFPRELEALCV